MKEPMSVEQKKKLKCWEKPDYKITSYSHPLFGKMNRYSNDPFVTPDDYQDILSTEDCFLPDK